MSEQITFYVLVGVNDLDGVFVRGIYSTWNKAASNLDSSVRIKEIVTLKESM